MKKETQRFTRASFLSAATTLLEDVIPEKNCKPFGLGDIPIRELTAAQRLEAVEVAKVYDADGEEITLTDGTTKIDSARYWAAIITMSVLDPSTCYDEQGAFVEGVGSLLLTPDDIFDLSERGKEVLQALAQRIMSLSWLTRADMFRFSKTPDDPKPPEGAEPGAADTGAIPQGMEPSNDGAVLGDGDVGVGAIEGDVL